MPRYDDATFRYLRGEIATLGTLGLRVGIVGPAASQVEDGSDLTLAQLGLIHEYGAVIIRGDGTRIEIPERSWLRSTLIAHREDLARLRIVVLKRVLAGTITARAAMEFLGEQVTAWIRARIVAGIDPPNATSTILAKGSTKPLIDHGQLYRAISYEVVEVAAVAPKPAVTAA